MASGWANKRWLAENLGVHPSKFENFLSNYRHFLREYTIKVPGRGVFYAVDAVRLLFLIPTARERREIWAEAKPPRPPIPTFPQK